MPSETLVALKLKLMYFMRFICLNLILPALALGQAPQQTSPSDLFQRAQSRLLADMKRQTHYTCAQDIVRRFYRSESKEASCTDIIASRAKRKRDLPLTSWDHLQLDVAIADNREIHSWPGAPTFEEDEIRELAGNGPFGSGDFAGFIVGVFGGSATIKFENVSTASGRLLFEYAFEVTQNASNYKIADSGATIITSYEGSFLLDPQTADLIHLTVRTAAFPGDSYACKAISEIEYGRVDLHGDDALMHSFPAKRILGWFTAMEEKRLE
jgi:hypothetical protein